MILALDGILKGEWLRSTDPERRESIEELMSFILIGFRAGLQGEEIPLVLLGGLLFFWGKTRLDPDPFTMITLYERLKGETGYM